MKIADIIAQGTKEMLSESLTRLDIPHKMSMRKADLVSLLANAALNPKTFETMLAAADDEAIGILDEAAEGIGSFGSPVSVMDLGLMGYIRITDKGFKLADDVIELYRSIRWSESFLTIRNIVWPLSEYISCFVSLYGVIDEDDAFKLYAKYTGKVISKEQREVFLRVYNHKNISYTYSEGHFIHLSLCDEEIWRNLLEIQGDVPFYEPPHWMIHSYSSDWFFERSAAYYRLADFIRSFFEDEEEYREMMSNITFAIQDEGSISDILEVVEEGFTDEMDRPNPAKLKALISEYMDNMRLWSNRGYTNRELDRLFSPDNGPAEDNKPVKTETKGKILKFGEKNNK